MANISILLVATKGYKRLSMLLLPTRFEEDISDFLINEEWKKWHSIIAFEIAELQA